MNGDWGISYEIALKWMPPDLTDDKSTLVMTWCHQAASHYLSQCWPRSLSPDGITRPQWVNGLVPITQQAVALTNVHQNFLCHVMSLGRSLHFKLVPPCTCPIFHNAPFRTEMCTFLIWTVGYGTIALWDLWDWSILMGSCEMWTFLFWTLGYGTGALWDLWDCSISMS